MGSVCSELTVTAASVTCGCGLQLKPRFYFLVFCAQQELRQDHNSISTNKLTLDNSADKMKSTSSLCVESVPVE